jgi:hypothetical protein
VYLQRKSPTALNAFTRCVVGRRQFRVNCIFYDIERFWTNIERVLYTNDHRLVASIISAMCCVSFDCCENPRNVQIKCVSYYR